MQTIDPTIGSHNNEASGFSSNMDEESVGSIRALQERKEVYRQDCKAFLGRLRQFMNIKFQAEMVDIQKTLREADAVGQAGRQSGGIQKPKLMGHDHAYASFYRFSGLLLFAKEVDKDEFLELQRVCVFSIKGNLCEFQC